MAKKQTRRSISVSRTTYERLKAFCETNNISMSQLVETRVNDFLGSDGVPAVSFPAVTMPSAPPRPIVPRPAVPSAPVFRPVEARPVPAAQPPAPAAVVAPISAAPAPAPTSPVATSVPLTSAAARFVVDPPLPIIKPRQDTAAPKPAEKRPEQIFTF